MLKFNFCYLKHIKTLIGHNNIWRLDINRNDILISGLDDKTIKIWNMKAWLLNKTLTYFLSQIINDK